MSRYYRETPGWVYGIWILIIFLYLLLRWLSGIHPLLLPLGILVLIVGGFIFYLWVTGPRENTKKTIETKYNDKPLFNAIFLTTETRIKLFFKKIKENNEPKEIIRFIIISLGVVIGLLLNNFDSIEQFHSPIWFNAFLGYGFSSLFCNVFIRKE